MKYKVKIYGILNPPKVYYFLAGNLAFLFITAYDHLKCKIPISIINDDEVNLIKKQDIDDDKLIFSNYLKLNNLLYYKKGLNKPFQCLSYSFNNKVKEIFNIDSVEYKSSYNYDFNKISDFFLNIHIFFN